MFKMNNYKNFVFSLKIKKKLTYIILSLEEPTKERLKENGPNEYTTKLTELPWRMESMNMNR